MRHFIIFLARDRTRDDPTEVKNASKHLDAADRAFDEKVIEIQKNTGAFRYEEVMTLHLPPELLDIIDKRRHDRERKEAAEEAAEKERNRERRNQMSPEEVRAEHEITLRKTLAPLFEEAIKEQNFTGLISAFNNFPSYSLKEDQAIFKRMHEELNPSDKANFDAALVGQVQKAKDEANVEKPEKDGYDGRDFWPLGIKAKELEVFEKAMGISQGSSIPRDPVSTGLPRAR